jgi:pyruvate dehydrogenase E1 component alpha subunit
MEENVILKEKKINIYKKMFEIREFEKNVKKAFDIDAIKCPIYLSIGQESISSTISEFFKPKYIFTQHRGHSTYIAFGGDKEKLIDELLGKENGCNKGKGGSPGIQDINIGMIGHHGLIGENVPLSVGAALGSPNEKVLCVFGDGALEEDYVFSSITFAYTHKLPILFICEDNNLSILTKKLDRRSWELTDALKGIGMSAADIIDDPKLIAQKINEFENNLPAFINCKTCRHMWHTGTGQDEIPKIDRLNEFKIELLKEGFNANELIQIEEKIKIDMDELWKKHLQKQ